jgi:2-polyprenyl-6-hydroxyphenyl methylase/3-demethylubiquinone-9 3-methyltransferase
MAIGPAVRRAFGPFEHQITGAYRSIYIDLDDYVAAVRDWVPQAGAILEVGCGEGAVTERLAIAYPDARITAIDITPRVGRLYRGPTEHVTFEQRTVQDIAAESPASFDMVMIADVIHHVPASLRTDIIGAARAALAPGGAFIFKEWERTRTPIHWMCVASDRWLTGDEVSFLNREEARALLAESFGPAAVTAERRVRPWRNNLMMFVSP